MDRPLASQRLVGDLADAVRDHLIDVHVELGAAACHPDVQREHVAVLAIQYFVADLDDQIGLVRRKAAAGLVGACRSLLENGIGIDHFTRNKIYSDTEMLATAASEP